MVNILVVIKKKHLIVNVILNDLQEKNDNSQKKKRNKNTNRKKKNKQTRNKPEKNTKKSITHNWRMGCT